MSTVTYCRLCAGLAPSGALDLAAASLERSSIISKLNRLNIDRTVDFTIRDNLPKVVCARCVELLCAAYDFVVNIESAQIVLRSLFSVANVKQEKKEETTYSDGCNNDYPHDDDDEDIEDKKPLLQLKQEVPLNSDNDVNDGGIKKRRKPRRKKKKIQLKTELFKDDDVTYNIKETWNDYPWKCRLCDERFSDVQQLRSHSVNTHKICCAFKCLDCDKQSSSFDYFISHVKRHRKHLKHCCHFCNSKFDCSATLKTHLLAHELSNRCEICGSSFSDDQLLQEHREKYFTPKKRQHLQPACNKEDLTCMQCDKTFKSRANLLVHQLIHTERRRDHTCDKCGKTFFNKGTLGSHMILHEDSRPFKCEICGATFKTQTQLRSHVGIHGGPRPYSCEQCGRSFRLRCHLKSHLIIHTDSMPHTCEFCGKAFRFKTILTQHLRQHTGVKPYVCQHCMRDFTNWPNYNKHMKRRHGIDTAKKKHTPDGVFPINPLTGEVQMLPTNVTEAEEWRDKIMNQIKKPGRPKLGIPTLDLPKVVPEVPLIPLTITKVEEHDG